MTPGALAEIEEALVDDFSHAECIGFVQARLLGVPDHALVREEVGFTRPAHHPRCRSAPTVTALSLQARMNIEDITWTNLSADIYLGLHASAVRLYMDSVVKPALDAIDARRDELERDEDPVAIFMKADVEELRKSAIEAFALAIQSLWERQLRQFLKGCARELKRGDALVKSLATDDWTKLVRHFGDLRGVPLENFDSFEDLDLLQLLGNACRHGDGKSANMLHDRWPELWPAWLPSPPDPWPPLPGGEAQPLRPPFSTISVPRALLDRVANAVIWFWEDHNYIYTNSLLSKPRSVADSLQAMRDDRARRPPRQSIAAMRTVGGG